MLRDLEKEQQWCAYVAMDHPEASQYSEEVLRAEGAFASYQEFLSRVLARYDNDNQEFLWNAATQLCPL